MIIRKATKDDLPTLTEIYNQNILSGPTTAQWEPVTLEDRQTWFDQTDRNSHPVFLASENDNILGYLALSPYREGRAALAGVAEVSYFVDKDHLNRGVGSTLMTAVLERCPDLGIHSLLAILLEHNHASIALLRKYDFEQWGHLPNIALRPFTSDANDPVNVTRRANKVTISKGSPYEEFRASDTSTGSVTRDGTEHYPNDSMGSARRIGQVYYGRHINRI